MNTLTGIFQRFWSQIHLDTLRAAILKKAYIVDNLQWLLLYIIFWRKLKPDQNLILSFPFNLFSLILFGTSSMRHSFLLWFPVLLVHSYYTLDFLVFYFYNIQYLSFIASLHLPMFFFVDLFQTYYGNFAQVWIYEIKQSIFYGSFSSGNVNYFHNFERKKRLLLLLLFFLILWQFWFD